MFARASKVLVNGVALASAATIALTHRTNAQAYRRVEIAPTLGAYSPTGRLPMAGYTTDVCFNDGTGGCRSDAVKQNGGVAIGGRVTVWFSHRAAVEGSFSYSPSDVTGFIQGEVNAPGSVVLGGLHFLIRQSLAPQAPAGSILLIAGPVVIRRSGDYFAYRAGGTSLGGVLGIGLDLRPGRHFGLRAEIDDNLYSLKLSQGSSGTRAFQQDFVLSLSISPFGQRGERR